MIFSDSSRKYITLGVVLIVIIGVIIALLMAKKQNETFRTQDMLYSYISQQVAEGQYEEALLTASSLEEQQKKSEPLNYVIALAAVNAAKGDLGIVHMQRVLDLNPYKIEDPIFMIQYAEALIIAEKKEEALLVLERSEVLPIPADFPEFQEHIARLKEEAALK